MTDLGWTLKIRLVHGEALTVRVENADTWDHAFKEALDAGTMIQVQNEEGHALAINPQQVAYLEEIPDEVVGALRPTGGRRTATIKGNFDRPFGRASERTTQAGEPPAPSTRASRPPLVPYARGRLDSLRAKTSGRARNS